MHINQSHSTNALLSTCALLRWFDRDTLCILTNIREETIDALLSSDRVIPTTQSMYQLREDIRIEVLTQLRSEHPSEELTLHRHIFEHFLQDIQKTEANIRYEQIKDYILYHLSQFFLLIATRQEWNNLSEIIIQVRAQAANQDWFIPWLDFYEGFLAIRTQKYAYGEESLTHLLKNNSLDDRLRVQVLNALGQLHWFQIQYDHALHRYEQTYELARKINDLFYQAGALANMGMIYKDLEYYEQALTLSTQSLELFRELRDSYREAHILFELGNILMRLGRWQLAQQHFQQAIEIHEVFHIPARLAYLHWGQGLLYHMLGDEAASESAYLHAHELVAIQEHGQPDLALDIHFQLGFLYQTQERWEDALIAYDHALILANQLSNQYSAIFIHYRRGNIFEYQGLSDSAYDEYSLAIEGIEMLRGTHKSQEIKIGLLGTAQQVYESMVRLCLTRGHTHEAFHYVERARSQAFLDLLASKSNRHDTHTATQMHSDVSLPAVTVAHIQAHLDSDSLLIEYFTIGVVPRGENLINKLPLDNTRVRAHLTLTPQVLIFAITYNHVEVFHPTLDPNTLRPQPGDPGPGRRLLRDRLLTHLYEQLIEPTEQLMRGRSQLFIIPHGPLHYVPFMALRSTVGVHLLDSTGPAIALAPSATILLRNCLNQPTRVADHPLPLLALGYNDHGEDALRYAEAEAQHIARLAHGQAWVGNAAKGEQLLSAGHSARWLHIAGHAIYDPHDPLGSYLCLGDNDTLSARTIIDGMDLNADLVTLSACMSGLNRVAFGDELLGLQRALLYAGAPTVVCTLWEASDLVALVVMDHFYTALQQGQSAAAALRDAQVMARTITGRGLLTLIEHWRNSDPAFVAALGELPTVPPEMLDAPIYAEPFYWAPFMLIGRPS